MTPNPNRIDPLSTATLEKAEPNILKPAAGAILPQWAVVTLTLLTIAAGVVVMIPGMHPTVVAIAGGITAVGAALGIASPGIRRQP